MTNVISAYNALCNLGNNIDEIYNRAINGVCDCFEYDGSVINNRTLRIGRINIDLPEISNPDFNTRCNKLILKNLELMKKELEELFKKYSKEDIGVIVATTNTGVEEYETTRNKNHCEQGNPALFAKEYLGLSNYYTTVSSACSSGTKALSMAGNMLDTGFLRAVIVIGVDSLAKITLFGFSSLEILSDKPSNPFSKNYTGINIAEAVSCFILEKKEEAQKNGIEILSIVENTDTNHFTTPNPKGEEAIDAINTAIYQAGINKEDVDYINLHGTGTLANDTMEAAAINAIFAQNTPTSSTKQLTGHCLGCASSVETALLCKLMDSFDSRLFPHIFDEQYNPDIKKIKLVKKDEKFDKCKICMNNSFGFGGANAILILRKD